MEYGSLRRYERDITASQYPSIVTYRKTLTQYQTEKAAAGKFYMGNPSDSRASDIKPGMLVPAIIIAYLFLTRGK